MSLRHGHDNWTSAEKRLKSSPTCPASDPQVSVGSVLIAPSQRHRRPGLPSNPASGPDQCHKRNADGQIDTERGNQRDQHGHASRVPVDCPRARTSTAPHRRQAGAHNAQISSRAVAQPLTAVHVNGTHEWRIIRYEGCRLGLASPNWLGYGSGNRGDKHGRHRQQRDR